MAHNLRVLAGSSIRQDPAVLEFHMKHLAALKTPPGVTLDFAFINDQPDGEARATFELVQEFLPGAKFYETDEARPEEAHYAVGEQTHEWREATFEWLARQKQRILDLAIQDGYDYFLLVDSDLLLEPTTLVSLLATEAPIASAVFWTSWQRGSVPQPQVWLRHPYGMEGLGVREHEFIQGLVRRQAMRVAGGGACCLIHTDALSRGLRWHPRLDGLPSGGMWQGEDRTFAKLAERYHVRQYADAWPDIYHAYHPEQRQPDALVNASAALLAPRQLHAKVGDLVSFHLSPMEDAGLQDALEPPDACIRGRLGCLDIQPEVDAALRDMQPGEQQVVKVAFPAWYPYQPYRGQAKHFLLKLVDVKPNLPAPTLDKYIHRNLG